METKTGKIKILEIIRISINTKNKRNRTERGYKYECLIDGNIDTIYENGLKRGQGCNVCTNDKVLKGINDIATTHPHLIKYFSNIEDNYIYTYGNDKKVLMKCPDCGFEKKMQISTLSYYGFSCNKCGDGISYPEKVMFSVIEQLEINFEYHKTFDWSKNVQVDNARLCGSKEYDFYFKLNNEYFVIETHGRQHYEENNGFNTIEGAKEYKEEVENDRLKKELALVNSVKEENYIVIDCRKSELDWIKGYILESNLAKLFDLSKIDWNKAEKFALSSRVKEACQYKKNNPNIMTKDISKLMNMDRQTLRKYFKKGNKIGWCYYNAEEESKKGIANSKIVWSQDKNILFKSISDCERQSLKLFGVKITSASISAVCNNKQIETKGYQFKFISDLTPEEYIKYDIVNKLKELEEKSKESA